MWRFNKVNPLPNRIFSGFWGIDAFEAIDLTDENIAFIVIKENEEPFTSPYKITRENLMIQSFDDKINFRILSLTPSQLVVVMSIKAHLDGGKKLEGDVAEIFYEPYSKGLT